MLSKCVYKEQCCQRFLPDQLWRRIMGESKVVCDLVRLNAKSRLQEKFRKLVDQRLDQQPQSQSGAICPSNVNSSSITCSAVPCGSRVSLIGDVLISENALSLLDLGPSSAPSQSMGPRVARKIVGSLQFVQRRLRQRANIEQHKQDRPIVLEDSLPNIPFPRLQIRPQEPYQAVDTKFRILATSVFQTLINLAKKTRK